MECESRDTNVVERANVPKVSTLDDIVNLYSHRDKVDIRHQRKLPYRKTYWETAHDIFV